MTITPSTPICLNRTFEVLKGDALGLDASALGGLNRTFEVLKGNMDVPRRPLGPSLNRTFEVLKVNVCKLTT